MNSRPADACIFCAIVSGTQQAQIVYEDADALAFLDITAVMPGHTLVIPKAHAADLWEIDAASWSAVMGTVHRVAQRIGDVLKPEGMTLFQANRAAGWQDVFHLHVHLVPRMADDHLHRPWTAPPVPLETLDEVRARISLSP